jgi:hypothetical protein
MAYTPVDEIRRDYDGKIVFDKWVLRIETIKSQMSDTAVLSSHEFYREMRNTYHNAQRMLDLPGAPQFVEMTAELFKKSSHGADEEEVPVPAPTGSLN